MKQRYYVSYMLTNGNQTLTTARIVDTEEVIKTVKDIESLARGIAHLHGILAAPNSIVILAWNLLEQPKPQVITDV